jgi:hypothetical protein
MPSCLPRVPALVLALLAAAPAGPAGALVVGGGGPRGRDCISVFDAAANFPLPPRPPRHVDCVDGDPGCDADGARNARCLFDVRLCLNSTAISGCTPLRTNNVSVHHAIDNGDPLFDVDFQALQQRVSQLLPDNEDLDDCTQLSSLTVALKPPGPSGVWRTNVKRLRLTAAGFAGGRPLVDRDRMRFTCRPEGDGFYAPRDLYTGTFDRIRQEVFAVSCAKSGCHDSESHQADLILLPNAAYSQLVGVVPTTAGAADDGLERVMPGDPDLSLLYRKLTPGLPPEYGPAMPLTGPAPSATLVEIIRLWIIGDATLGPAPEDGWVEGTD